MIKALELNVILMDVEPYVWRKILVKDDITFEKFHSILQATMGWEDNSLYEFETLNDGFENIGTLYSDLKNDATKMTLKDIFNFDDVIGYIYDVQKSKWVHRIERKQFWKVKEDQQYPICLEGENQCPPEKSKGAENYVNLMGAFRDKEHKDYKKSRRVLGKDFDPTHFDLKAINKRLKKIK